MTSTQDKYADALDRAVTHARDWLGCRCRTDRYPRRRRPTSSARGSGTGCRADRTDPAAVVDELAAGSRAGADGDAVRPVLRLGDRRDAARRRWPPTGWSAPGTRTPACAMPPRRAAAVEEVAGGWLLDLLGLPAGADVGFVTGATMANFTGLGRRPRRGAGRRRAGTSTEDGLAGAPRVTVLVGAERHDTVDLALRYLGLGRARRGRRRRRRAGSGVDALAAALGRRADGPTIVVPAGGQPALGRVRPVRGGDRPRAPARRLGARGRRVRAVGGGLPPLRHLVAGVRPAPTPGRPTRTRR